ncbi:MAG: ferritin-like domain-containing protein [Polyangiaceae bacterium]
MDRTLSRIEAQTPSFTALRTWMFAALGLVAAGCGGNVTISGSGGGGAGGGTGAGCAGSAPILQPDGKTSGFVTCADGSIDRAAQAACTVKAVDTCTGTEATLNCLTGKDCTEKPYGSCIAVSGGAPGPETTWCQCQYQCSTDADCDPGFVCACAGVADPSVAYCIPKDNCATDADCTSGECGLSAWDNGCGTTYSVACRSAADTCRVKSECTDPAYSECGVDSAGNPFKCQPVGCAIGRPLFVGDTLLFAPAERRADWTEPSLTPDLESLTPSVRASLAAHFKAMAAMEHASIGSFARFALELLALGAPPALLTATQDAAADEILHARLAYSLATAYSGAPVGPGKLPVAGVAPATDPAEIVIALVREACVGETIAAAEALTLSSMVKDPALVSVYTRVSKDEARHAELGWRSLAWILSERPSLLPVAEEAFAQSIAAISSAPLACPEELSPDHGLLPSAALASLRAKAAREIVEPCRRALLEKAIAPSPEVTLAAA